MPDDDKKEEIDKPLILIVDDAPENIQILGNILNEIECRIAVATNGADALSLVEESLPDLILLDVVMPELNGYEVCKKLREIHTIEDLPIIFITAKTEMEDVIKGFEVGAVDYVTKPFNSVELIARVNTHLKLKKTMENRKEMISELQQALEKVKLLSGLIPICANCHKIRDDEGYWQKIDSFIEKHSEAEFSHGLCLDCAEKLYGDKKWFKREDYEKKYGEKK